MIFFILKSIKVLYFLEKNVKIKWCYERLESKSISEGKEKCSTCLNPQGRISVSGHFEEHHKVGAMTSRTQFTFSEHRLIEWAIEYRRVDLFLVLRCSRHHLDHRTLGEELLGLGVRNDMFFLVPLTSFEEYAVNVAAVCRFLLDVVFCQFVLENEVKDYLIDGDHVLTGVVLHHTSDECLREEEARNPEMIRGS
jgi:hypothetical protein